MTAAAKPGRVSRLAWIALPLSVSLYQIVAKVVADHIGQHSSGLLWLEDILSQPLLLLLIGSEAVSLALWLYVLARMQLSEAFPLAAISYVFVVLASWTLFHETGSVSQVMGIAAILVGAWLIGRPQDPDD